MIKTLILFLFISLGLYFYFYEGEQKMAVKEIFPVNLADKYNFQSKRINGREIAVSISEHDASFNGDVTKFSDRTTPITHEVKTIQIPDDYDVQDANSEAFLLMTNFKSTVADLIVGLDVPTMGILLLMMIILLFMGAFMDWVGIVLLIIPVFLPIVQRLPIEEIGLIGELQPKYLAVWFGVLFCMNMPGSFLSPPFGPAAFYLKSVAPAHISLTDIFKGFLPFIGIQILALTVLLIWPPIIEVLL